MDFVPWLFPAIGVFVILAVLIKLSVFTIHTKQAAIVERFGKFERIAGPGLNFKTPLIEKVVYTEDLNMQLMDVPVMSKTKDGLRESVLNFEEGVQGVDPHEVMALLMMTQYFDALRDIGAQSNTILLPHSPAAVSDLYAQLRTAITAGNVAAIKSTEQPPPKK